MEAEIFKYIFFLLSFIIVIFLAFFFTKYIARKTNLLNKSKHIKIIEIISLGNNTRIIIMEILEAYYIVYDNSSHLLLLDKISKEDVNIQFENLETGNDSFNNIIGKLLLQKDNVIEKLGKGKKG